MLQQISGIVWQSRFRPSGVPFSGTRRLNSIVSCFYALDHITGGSLKSNIFESKAPWSKDPVFVIEQIIYVSQPVPDRVSWESWELEGAFCTPWLLGNGYSVSPKLIASGGRDKGKEQHHMAGHSTPPTLIPPPFSVLSIFCRQNEPIFFWEARLTLILGLASRFKKKKKNSWELNLQ